MVGQFFFCVIFQAACFMRFYPLPFWPILLSTESLILLPQFLSLSIYLFLLLIRASHFISGTYFGIQPVMETGLDLG